MLNSRRKGKATLCVGDIEKKANVKFCTLPKFDVCFFRCLLVHSYGFASHRVNSAYYQAQA